MTIIVIDDSLSKVESPELKYSIIAETFPKYISTSDVKPKAEVNPNRQGLIVMSSKEPMCFQGPTNNSLVNAIVYAYNNHIGLTLAPDDIMQCMASTISQIINDNAEKLRDEFVNHAGQKQLLVKCDEVYFNSDVLLKLMSNEINKNIKTTLELESDFSSSNSITRNSAILTKMSAFKKYFSYGFELGCGLRSVNLTGTVDDWNKLRQKIRTNAVVFAKYDLAVNWFKHLDTIVSNIILTLDGMTDDLKLFWSRIVTFVPYGSGRQHYISGWCKVLYPGENYNKFLETLNLLDSKSVPPVMDRDLYNWQYEYKQWAQLCEDASYSTCVVDAELNDHGLTYDMHFVTGRIGWRVVDGYAQAVIGYYAHAIYKGDRIEAGIENLKKLIAHA